jgi:excisionase family DNA binding protein
MKLLMTVNEFCSEFGVSRSTVYRLNARGELPFVHIGRSVRIRGDVAKAWFDALGAENDN